MDCNMTKDILVFYRFPEHGIGVINKMLEMLRVRARAQTSRCWQCCNQRVDRNFNLRNGMCGAGKCERLDAKGRRVWPRRRWGGLAVGNHGIKRKRGWGDSRIIRKRPEVRNWRLAGFGLLPGFGPCISTVVPCGMLPIRTIVSWFTRVPPVWPAGWLLAGTRMNNPGSICSA